LVLQVSGVGCGETRLLEDFTMFRSIVAAIVSALRSAFMAVGRVATVPLRFIDRLLGGSASPWGIPEAAPAHVEDPAGQAPMSAIDWNIEYAKEANVVMNWAATSIIDDGPAELPSPPRCSRATREWLKGLTRDECEILLNSGEKSISQHLRDRERFPGLRKVQPLEATRWEPLLPMADPEMGSGGFLLNAGPRPA
jgi:hypothetical protein